MTEQMGVSIHERNIPVSWIYGGAADPSNCLLCLATQTLKTGHLTRRQHGHGHVYPLHAHFWSR